ncbi:hypothetical protein D3C87_1737280 [compost metagenome]
MIGAVRAHEAQAVGHRVEVDNGAFIAREFFGEGRFDRGSARGGVDGDDFACKANAIEEIVGGALVDAGKAIDA